MKLHSYQSDGNDMGWKFTRLDGGVYHTYCQTEDWPKELRQWLCNTLGKPSKRYKNKELKWDYLGNNIYLYKEEYVTLFLLRWL